MTTLEIMINKYEALEPTTKAYADKHLPTFDEVYDRNLNHWINPAKNIEWAMEKTIAEFTMWFDGLATNNYGLQDQEINKWKSLSAMSVQHLQQQ